MKKVMSLIVGASFFASAAYPCTRILWNEPDQAVVVARTMDWESDLGTNLWVFPREMSRAGLNSGRPLTWTSRYGSVIATAHDISTTDGINEAGLNASVLWLAESNYGVRDLRLPGLGVAIWTQFFLDNFASVAEAVDFVRTKPFQIVGQAFQGHLAALHLSLADASGDSAVIEYLDGKPTIYHDRSYRVMTNSPAYSIQLARLAQYQGFGGARSLPGTNAATDRFVRASYYLRQLSGPQSPREALAGVVSIIRNVSQPFGIPADPSRPNLSPTRWRTVADLTHGRYYFESTLSLNTFWVELKDFDLRPSAPTMKLDLATHADRAGNLSRYFEAARPFRFLLE